MIKTAQRLGFTLGEIAELLKVGSHRGPRPGCCARWSGMSVIVLGASGVAGHSLVPHLLSDGHDVTVQAGTMPRLQTLADAGGTPFPGDASDPQTLRNVLRGHDAVYDLRVSVPRTSRAVIAGSLPRSASGRGRGCGQVADAALDVGCLE